MNYSFWIRKERNKRNQRRCYLASYHALKKSKHLVFAILHALKKVYGVIFSGPSTLFMVY